MVFVVFVVSRVYVSVMSIYEIVIVSRNYPFTWVKFPYSIHSLIHVEVFFVIENDPGQYLTSLRMDDFHEILGRFHQSD